VSGRILHEAVRTARPIADDDVLRVREVCQFGTWGISLSSKAKTKTPLLLRHPSRKRTYYNRAVMADAGTVAELT